MLVIILFDHENSLFEELECLQHLEYTTLTIITEHDVRKLQNSHKLQSVARLVEFSGLEGLTSLSLLSLRSMSRLSKVKFVECELEVITFNQDEQKTPGLPPDKIPSLNLNSLKNLHQVIITRCNKVEEHDMAHMGPKC